MKFLSYMIVVVKQLIRSKERLSYTIAMPILFIALTAFIFGQGTLNDILDPPTNETTYVGLVNNDYCPEEWQDQFLNYLDQEKFVLDPFQGGFGNSFSAHINASNAGQNNAPIWVLEYPTMALASKALNHGHIALVMVVPVTFSQTYLAELVSWYNQSQGLTVTSDPLFQQSETQLALYGNPSSIAFARAQNRVTIQLESFLEPYSYSANPSFMNVEVDQVITQKTTEFDLYVPGLVVLVLLFGSSATAGVVAHERAGRTIERLQLSNFPPLTFLAGLTGVQILLGSIQFGLALVTSYLLGFSGGGDLLFAYMVAILLVFPFTGLALVIAGLTTGKVATGVMATIGLPLSFFTGSFIPLPEVGRLAGQSMWNLLPVYSAGQALRKILLLDYQLGETPEIVSLFIIGIAWFFVGVLVFLKRAYKSYPLPF